VLLYARLSLAVPSIVQQLVKYCWCFWVKCEESGARSAETAADPYQLDQVFRNANIAYGVVNTREVLNLCIRKTELCLHYFTKCTRRCN
jgi:hypothetical protein